MQPIYKKSRKLPQPKAACSPHLSNVLNRFKAVRFTVEKVPKWRPAKECGGGAGE